MEQVASVKREKFDQWLKALRSGEYVQTANNLCEIIEDDQYAYCCVGVLDEVVYGTQWHPSDGCSILEDDDGKFDLMSHSRVTDMELDKFLTNEETEFFTNLLKHEVKAVSRLDVLALANDTGLTFETIADVIEELNWNE